ncbi:MAG: MerR family transcriptional regulator [Naasia sp.]
MSALPAPDAPPASAPLLNIGQVLAKLKPEYPDLTPSKVRFLEDERLLSPARTESGYRKFSTVDLDRLRLILTLQRDQYLPLKVIRAYLADLDSGRSPSWPGHAAAEEASLLEGDRRLTREELLRESGSTSALLDESIRAGLLPAADLHVEASLVMLKSLVELGRVGIEPRHLRAVRTAAEREVGLIESAVQPTRHKKDPAARARAAEEALELASHLDVVRTGLVRAALQRMSG